MKKFAKVLVLVLVVVFALAMLVSCGTPDYDNLVKKLDDNGYVFILKAKDDDGSYVITATKITESIAIYAFSNGDDLKKFKETDTYKTAKEKADKSDSYVLKTAGNAIIFGTKAAADLV